MRDEPTLRAAGGVVVSDGLILVVHRPRYDDWSLPKGKLDADETWEDAALREIEEETGLVCRLGRALTTSRYAVDGETKEVRYWIMHPVADSPNPRDDEVDELRWLAPTQAAALMSYEHDAALIEAAAELMDA